MIADRLVVRLINLKQVPPDGIETQPTGAVMVSSATRRADVWVWLHATHLADPGGELRLERLRSRRLLEWLAMYASSQLHDKSPPYVVIDD
ncbi:MAG TPA: hypothetical protein VK137_10975 [Planctomycetaceae bacterium]|nr:hypothetical protein [Planctomycetaceae bacterium]